MSGAPLSRQAARRAELGRRYGDPQLGDALAAIVLTLGRPRRVLPGGADPWTVVERWDVGTADWLRTLPQNPDVWQPLASEVRAARRSATTAARRKAAWALKDVQEHAEFLGEPVSYAGPPADARACLRLAMSNEVYAYLASKKWRARAGLVAAGELPPLPDNLGAEDEDETDGGGPAAFPIAELRAELAEDEGFAP